MTQRRTTPTIPRIYVKPVGGLLVRQPERNYLPLPEEGAYVHPDSYWMTQLRDGAVIETAPPDEPTH